MYKDGWDTASLIWMINSHLNRTALYVKWTQLFNFQIIYTIFGNTGWYMVSTSFVTFKPDRDFWPSSWYSSKQTLQGSFVLSQSSHNCVFQSTWGLILINFMHHTVIYHIGRRVAVLDAFWAKSAKNAFNFFAEGQNFWPSESPFLEEKKKWNTTVPYSYAMRIVLQNAFVQKSAVSFRRHKWSRTKMYTTSDTIFWHSSSCLFAKRDSFCLEFGAP